SCPVALKRASRSFCRFSHMPYPYGRSTTQPRTGEYETSSARKQTAVYHAERSAALGGISLTTAGPAACDMTGPASRVHGTPPSRETRAPGIDLYSAKPRAWPSARASTLAPAMRELPGSSAARVSRRALGGSKPTEPSTNCRVQSAWLGRNCTRCTTAPHEPYGSTHGWH